MELDKELYNQLKTLRSYLKQDGKQKQGTAPLVCNDDALLNIARLRPRTVADFKGISGVGPKFMDNYAQYFVEVINIYETTLGEEKEALSQNSATTLRELEKKLVNINRRNRLLYMPRLYARNDFDLFRNNEAELMDFLFAEGTTITICDKSLNDPAEEKNYQRLVTLLREANREVREKGINNLYVAYPFVRGCMRDETFKVRCPLALFPVRAIRNADAIKLEYDDSRDVLFNRTLILGYFKFENINKSLPEVAFEGEGREEFLNALLKFYGDSGLKIKTEPQALSNFKNYTKDTFPETVPGEYNLEHNMVLGRFFVCDSAIQHDFDTLISRGEINTLLAELVSGVHALTEKPWLNNNAKVQNELECLVYDKDISYICNIDGAQEKVLECISHTDRLVVQGPPGTGKSQVITNLIAQFALENKTVLLVSEKKTALDVVYSRLGNLSKYVMLIDDVGNKDLFYQQIKAMLEEGTEKHAGTNESIRAASVIDKDVYALDFIKQTLFKDIPDLNISLYKLLLEATPRDEFNSDADEAIDKFIPFIPKELLALPIDKLKSMRLKLEKSKLDEQIRTYFGIIHRCPFIANTRADLGISKDSYLMASFAHYVEYNEKCRYRGPLNITLHADARHFADLFFENEKDTIKELIIEHPRVVYDGLMNEYARYRRALKEFENYSRLERLYINTGCEMHVRTNIIDGINDSLYEAILRHHINLFVNKNEEAVQNMDAYHSIVRRMSQYISSKRDYSYKYLTEVLSESMGHMSLGKRNEEIRRIAHSNRKWNVNRFLNKYGFEVFDAINIWLMTPEVVSEIVPLNTGIFDLVIFDEASQMFVEKALPSIYRAKKVVIAGDSKQLRPSSIGIGRFEITDEETGEELDEKVRSESEATGDISEEEIAENLAYENESLLEVARYKYPDIWLNFHYRSKREELISFANYAFYDGRLQVTPNMGKHKTPAIEFIKVSNGRFINQTNIEEAKAVVELIKTLVKSKKPEATLGVITFNLPQRELIMDLLDEEMNKDPEWGDLLEQEMNRREKGEDKSLFVKNIESVQGDERDIIIFSIGYGLNEDGKFIRNFGWLNQKGGENRLNVAITRARYKEYVVASMNPSDFNVSDTKHDGPKYLRKFLEYSKYISDGDSENARKVLLSMSKGPDDNDAGRRNSFSNAVYRMLNDALRGSVYSVKRGSSVGENGIDFMVYKNSQAVLAIELDINVYRSSATTRERDYHKFKFLESRGLTVYRMFALNWWLNLEDEIEKLLKLIEEF